MVSTSARNKENEMLTNEKRNHIFEEMVSILELPEGAYKKAQDRYDDIGNWLAREESSCNQNNPHVFPQGSFRLGTAIRPLDEKEGYDLDLACNLRSGISKQFHSQAALKELIGDELESYREARGIKAPLDEKHRCWRLEYADTMSFHMDIVPCIPAGASRKKGVLEAIINAGETSAFAINVSELTVAITDDRHQGYRLIVEDWNISNPEGYAQWFEEQMNIALLAVMEKSQVDEIPVYKRKTPLQRVVQLLKRHRDQMFKDDSDVKPPSIIITTLAARAYRGEHDLESTLSTVLESMDDFINSKIPRVPNPVDPEEDFADRWSMPDYRHLSLEENFRNWLAQAREDFNFLSFSENAKAISDQLQRKFFMRIDTDRIGKILGVASVVTAPKAHIISKTPPRPWRSDT